MDLKLNRNQLKYIAIISMVIDHIGWAFFSTLTWQGQLIHFFGRLTGPIMAFMIAEGYLHTRDLKKYITRMGVFSLISWVPYSLYETGKIITPQLGVIFTLFLALLTICMWEKTNLTKELKTTLVVIACFASFLGDWPIFDILWPLFLIIYKDEPHDKWKSFIIIMVCEVVGSQFMAITSDHPYKQLFQFGAFMTLPLLMMYNGKPGSKAPFHKWFFYIFYPAHLLVIYAIKMLLHS